MSDVRPRLGLALLAWLLVVVTVGGVTYLVVDRATRALGQAPAARTVGVAPATVATPTPTPTPSRTRSAPPTSAATTPRPSAGPSPSTPGADEVRTTSFPTRGGTVVVSCRSGRVGLDSITVRDGWRFEDDTDDERVEVKLESGEDEIEMTIVCVGGEPTARED